MGLEISIEHNLKKVDANLKLLQKKLLPKAMKQALNKTLNRVVTKTSREFRDKERNMKVGLIKKKYIRKYKATGNNIATMQAKMWISGRGLHLLEFVRGSKDPRPQKGIAVRKRKKLKVRIRPSKTVTRKKLFIAKGHGGRNMVFRRQNNKLVKTPDQKGPLAAQTVPGYASIFRKLRFNQKIVRFANRVLLIEFNRSFNLQMSKMKK